MVILGIDPGSRITGYALIEKTPQGLKHVENGGIYCGEAPVFYERLVILFERVAALISQFSPDVLAIENIFHAKNVQSALKLGHARGSILACAGVSKVPVFEYTALQVKQSVCGFGHAPKEQVQQMVKTLLKLPQIAEENASDALAVAICHAHSNVLTRLLQTHDRKAPRKTAAEKLR